MPSDGNPPGRAGGLTGRGGPPLLPPLLARCAQVSPVQDWFRDTLAYPGTPVQQMNGDFRLCRAGPNPTEELLSVRQGKVQRSAEAKGAWLSAFRNSNLTA